MTSANYYCKSGNANTMKNWYTHVNLSNLTKETTTMAKKQRISRTYYFTDTDIQLLARNSRLFTVEERLKREFLVKTLRSKHDGSAMRRKEAVDIVKRIECARLQLPEKERSLTLICKNWLNNTDVNRNELVSVRQFLDNEMIDDDTYSSDAVTLIELYDIQENKIILQSSTQTVDNIKLIAKGFNLACKYYDIKRSPKSMQIRHVTYNTQDIL